MVFSFLYFFIGILYVFAYGLFIFFTNTRKKTHLLYNREVVRMCARGEV